jgi:hypothetical protein
MSGPLSRRVAAKPTTPGSGGHPEGWPRLFVRSASADRSDPTARDDPLPARSGPDARRDVPPPPPSRPHRRPSDPGNQTRSGASFNCLHAISIARPPNPHDTLQLLVSPSTNRMRQVCNSWGRGGSLGPGPPRSKSLVAFDKKLSGGLKIFPLIRTVAGRAGGVGPGVMGPTAGPVVADPAHGAGIRRAGAERACGVRRLHRDDPVPRRQSQDFPLTRAVGARAGAIAAVQTGPSVDPDVPKPADLALLEPRLGAVLHAPERPFRPGRSRASPSLATRTGSSRTRETVESGSARAEAGRGRFPGFGRRRAGGLRTVRGGTIATGWPLR